MVAVALVASLIVFPTPPGENSKEQKSFYVGVMYYVNSTEGGRNAAAEATRLIDRVKTYTNLFVLNAGYLQTDVNASVAIGDYAVNAGLDFILYFTAYDTYEPSVRPEQAVLNSAKARWGSHFLGVYYGNTPGEFMLDSDSMTLIDWQTGENITKRELIGNSITSLTSNKANGTKITYTYSFLVANFSSISVEYPNGTLVMWQNGSLIDLNSTNSAKQHLIYMRQSNATVDGNQRYPNGTVTATNYNYYANGTVTKCYTKYYSSSNGISLSVTTNSTSEVTIDKTDAPQVGTYQEALATFPLRTFDDAAERYVDHYQGKTEWLRSQSVPLFTSDYALHWFDYLGGYDTVLAQFDSNRSTQQEISLARGAANLQNKTWGATITSQYTTPPYLASGNKIYDQMGMAYEGGAKYIVIADYPSILGSGYGVLQDEHFSALERFWTEVVQNSSIANGGVKAEAAFVLPKNYGWGIQNTSNEIWGLWRTNATIQQIASQLQDKLATYGARLDIIYEDPAYPVAGKYQQIYYWNQTG